MPTVPAMMCRFLLAGGVAVSVSALPRALPTQRDAARGPRRDVAVAALLEGSIRSMGGRENLQRIRRVRFDQIVQWLTIRFDDAVHADAPLYNWRSDLRDYDANARRVTLRVAQGFASGGTTWPEVVYVTNDSAAMQESADRRTEQPLQIAYIDEQREDFATAPERLLLALAAAPDAHLGVDTTIGGQSHKTIVGTVPNVSPHPLTLFVNVADTTPAAVRYRVVQGNDAILAPLGDMEVEIWWTRWQLTPLADTQRVSYPMQWDVYRVGRPYQRVTTLAATFAVPATPDSFAISDSLRRAFLAGPTSKPMAAALPIDSATITEGHFAMLRRAIAPAFAVLVGNRWVLLEGASTVAQRQQQAAWLQRRVPGSLLGAGVVTIGSGIAAGSGVGSGWLVRQHVPVYIAPGAERAVAAVAANWGDHEYGTTLRIGKWIRLGADSARIEPVNLPRGPGSMILYVPSLQWIYSAYAITPIQTRFLIELAAKRGWKVTSTGSQLRPHVPLAPADDRSRTP